MKKSFIIVYSTFASLIILFAITFFGFNIYNEYEAGAQNAGNRFEKMCLEIKSIPSKYEINSKEFRKHVLSSINNLNDYLYLNIKINNQDYLTYPSDANKPEKKSKFLTYKTRSFKLNDNYISIEAYLHVLSPAKINYFSRMSFAIVLFVTTITLILILIESYKNISPKKKEEEDKTDEEPVTIEADKNYIDDNFIDESLVVVEDDEITENNDINEDNIDETQDDYSVEPEFDVENNYEEDNFNPVNQAELSDDIDKAIVNVESQISFTKDDAFENSLDDDPRDFEIDEYKKQLEENTQVELPSEEIKPISIENDDSPEGLFSPLTGFGWESYLKTRLDNELNRATASEIDLSVFVFKLVDIDRGSDLCHKICDYLSIQFQFKDMLFEYKEDCLVTVKIGTSIDEAISFANKLLLDIDNIIQGIGKCYIGISSRSIRMISGERILHEAEEAVKHAMVEEDSPIIAFRADVDKYRKYLENN